MSDEQQNEQPLSFGQLFDLVTEEVLLLRKELDALVAIVLAIVGVNEQDNQPE